MNCTATNSLPKTSLKLDFLNCRENKTLCDNDCSP
jgi:hypothetical protein